jgi:transcriptional regulator with XRE-family HTH domain
MPKCTHRVDGERIRVRREDLGLSRAKLANLVGIKPQSLESIEKGETKRTGLILELAEALGVSPEYLTGRTNDPTQHVLAKRLNAIIQDLRDEDKEEAIRLLKAWRSTKGD